MKKEAFGTWLAAKGQSAVSASSRISSARRVEQYLGDLDELFAQENRDSILDRFAYSSEDERQGRPNPSPVPIDGVLRTGLASIRQALELYYSFLSEQTNVPDKAEHQSLLNRLTRKEIDAAMQECDQLGLKAFLACSGFVSPQVWVADQGKEQTYPAKATVAAALGHLPQGRALAVKEFFNGFGESQSFARLEALGYRIVRKAITNIAKADLLPELTNVKASAPTNLILYGPPGTGKTYQTALEAVRLCLGEQFPAAFQGGENREALMAEYRRLVNEGRIEFVTFHQSMSYEEFVEGLRPSTGANSDPESKAGFRLEPVPGIFQRIARRAEDCMRHGFSSDEEARYIEVPLLSDTAQTSPDLDVGVSDTQEFGGPSDQDAHGLLFTVGNLPAVRSDTIRALAQDVAIELAKEWPNGFTLKQYRDALVTAGRIKGVVPTGGWENHNMPTWASHPNQGWLVPMSVDSELADPEAAKSSTNDVQHRPITKNDSYVLIIDEINRANISKVFGELITLLETDKRLGMQNEIRLTLPYSKKSFGVPANLHIIGTMNTADRSIALLDTALRRRFTFKELMPNPLVLSANVGGINLQKLLATINDRIEYVFDRDHQIGHAFLIDCKTRGQVEDVMRHKVIPLLAEYFYEDWSKVAAVLGDSAQGPSRFVQARQLTAPSAFTDDDFSGEKLRWRVKDQFDFSEFEV